MKTLFYEDNGGGIHALVFDEDGSVSNYLTGFQLDNWDVGELLRSAALGFEDADEYDPDEFNGTSLTAMFEEIVHSDAVEPPMLIAEVSREEINIYPGAMGMAGRKLFGLTDID